MSREEFIKRYILLQTNTAHSPFNRMGADTMHYLLPLMSTASSIWDSINGFAMYEDEEKEAA